MITVRNFISVKNRK